MVIPGVVFPQKAVVFPQQASRGFRGTSGDARREASTPCADELRAKRAPYPRKKLREHRIDVGVAGRVHQFLGEVWVNERG